MTEDIKVVMDEPVARNLYNKSVVAFESARAVSGIPSNDEIDTKFAETLKANLERAVADMKALKDAIDGAKESISSPSGLYTIKAAARLNENLMDIVQMQATLAENLVREAGPELDFDQGLWATCFEADEMNGIEAAIHNECHTILANINRLFDGRFA